MDLRKSIFGIFARERQEAHTIVREFVHFSLEKERGEHHSSFFTRFWNMLALVEEEK